MELMHK